MERVDGILLSSPSEQGVFTHPFLAVQTSAVNRNALAAASMVAELVALAPDTNTAWSVFLNTLETENVDPGSVPLMELRSQLKERFVQQRQVLLDQLQLPDSDASDLVAAAETGVEGITDKPRGLPPVLLDREWIETFITLSDRLLELGGAYKKLAT
jgi:hypothetical protein